MSDTERSEAARQPEVKKGRWDKPSRPEEDFAIDAHRGKAIRGYEDRPDPADPPE